MYVSKIDIKNYRLLKNTTVNCEKELSLIVGKNNCGKTSLLSILDKCIGGKGSAGNFDYFDFSLPFQNKLYAVIKGNANFDNDELKGIRVDIYIKYNNDDSLANLSNVLLDLDPDNNNVVLRFEYSLNNKLDEIKKDFAKYKENRNFDIKKEENSKEKNENFENSMWIRFIRKNHRKYFMYNQYSVFYDYNKNIIDEKRIKILNKNSADISKIISFSYIDAKRNIDNSSESELSNLSSNYYEKTKDSKEDNDAVLKFESLVDNTDKKFDEIYDGTFKDLVGKISKFGGIKNGDTNLKVISQIQTSKLLKDNTTVVYEDAKSVLPENYNGLGYLNLITMIIKIEILLNDFKKESKKDEEPSDINLLFIEEPEAHTHPQMQYVFIKNIKNLLEEGKLLRDSGQKINLQTFMTTHSSHIVSESNFDDIKYFIKVKDKDGNNAISKNLKELKSKYQKEKGDANNHFKFLKQYLTLNRSEVFFADKIILIEGDTERILLPAMIKKLDQENLSKKTELNSQNYIPLLSQNISIIEVGNYAHIYSDFIEFIGIKTLIITDIDTTRFNQSNTEACRVKNGTHTSNVALKYYLEDKIKQDSSKYKEELVKIKKEDKIIKFEENDIGKGSWVSDKTGNVMIVYQNEEINEENLEYNARSFEDAFFHINKKFFIGDNNDEKEQKKQLKKFQSLKNKKNFLDSGKDSYDLAKHCVDKKPSLAMDILINSDSDDGKDFVNWKTPLYIKEGLEWLQKN